MSQRLVLAVLVLAGCDRSTRLEGIVEVLGMSAQADVVLTSEDGRCSAQTDAGGAFAMNCKRGPIAVAVELASLQHYPQINTVMVPEAEPLSVGPWTLIPQPPSDGLWRVSDQGVQSLTQAHLVRLGDRGEKSYCLADDTTDEQATTTPGTLSLIDQQAPPWKLFRLDDEGCAQRWRWHAGDWRITASDELEGTLSELPNATVHHFELPAGRYFVADWTEGRLTADRAQRAAIGENRYPGSVIVVAE